jgi:hypothetical protein
MNNQTIFNISAIILMIAGFTTVIVVDDKGVELEPTHYCESLGIKMYCARTTEFYCYPKLDTRLGSKKCSEGWKVIPKQVVQSYKKIIVCDTEECKNDNIK